MPPLAIIGKNNASLSCLQLILERVEKADYFVLMHREKKECKRSSRHEFLCSTPGCEHRQNLEHKKIRSVKCFKSYIVNSYGTVQKFSINKVKFYSDFL
jgi:hypothetical protein